jgi:nicotinate-nucleotide adenylyltransferase
VTEAGARRRVGFFGGSFDPPHVGHVLAVAYVLSVHPVDEVLVVPVFSHPFAKRTAPFGARMAMCQAAFGWLPGVTVSDVEARLGGESRTLRTLEALLAGQPDLALRLVIGSDVVADLPKWHRWDRIAELAPPLVLARAGVAGEHGAELLPRVSSTEVREALAAGDLARAAPLVPRAVLEHVVAHRLYRP